MMKSKTATLLLSVAILVFGTAAQKDCGAKKNSNSPSNSASNNAMNNNTKPAANASPMSDGEIKTLAEGFNSKIEEPFLYVVRSAETYRQLQTAIDDLPSVAGIDFEKQAIVAAFAGTKSTGGYSVEIVKSGEKVAVSVENPPADAMLSQALTSPFKIAIVPVETENNLNLEISDEWKNAARIYNLTSGEFESSGGIAGRMKKFSAQGTIEIWQFGDLATLKFNLAGTNAEKNMRLIETASGTAKNGAIDLAQLDAGSFSEGPKPPLKVSGTISSGKLSLNFEPLPTNIRDGFSLRGKLEGMSTK
jgi:hypothetical protein